MHPHIKNELRRKEWTWKPHSRYGRMSQPWLERGLPVSVPWVQKVLSFWGFSVSLESSTPDLEAKCINVLSSSLHHFFSLDLGRKQWSSWKSNIFGFLVQSLDSAPLPQIPLWLQKEADVLCKELGIASGAEGYHCLAQMGQLCTSHPLVHKFREATEDNKMELRIGSFKIHLVCFKLKGEKGLRSPDPHFANEEGKEFFFFLNFCKTESWKTLDT